MEEVSNEIIVIVNTIKTDILATRNRIYENANLELSEMYFRIG